jgi:hypothetical protein
MSCIPKQQSALPNGPGRAVCGPEANAAIWQCRGSRRFFPSADAEPTPCVKVSSVSHLTRLLLIWLIATAVPLKGLAAVAMIGCGPSHHDGTRSSLILTADHSTHGALPSTEQTAVAKHVAADVVQASDADDDASPAPATDVGPKLKCSGCAPCCAAAAPAPGFSKLAHAEPRSHPPAARDDPFSGVATEVPHRPPRLILV